MQTLWVRATVPCASDGERSCLHVINYMLWHSATGNVSEHILHPKTLSNFGMASASVDVAILQLKGQICCGLLANSWKLALVMGKKLQIWGFHIRICCTICSMFSVPRQNTWSVVSCTRVSRQCARKNRYNSYTKSFVWIIKNRIFISIPSNMKNPRMAMYMPFIFNW